MNFVETLTTDFRDLLRIDRKKLKHPFIPAVVWKALGDEFDFPRWKAICRKFYVVLSHTESPDDFHYVNGAYIVGKPSEISIQISKIESVDELKFQLIQSIMHEYIHHQQAFCNFDTFIEVDNGPDDPYELYLGEWRETQAFAHCAFLERMYHGHWGTYTFLQYDTVSTNSRRMFYEYVFRWANKYKCIADLT